MTEPRTADADCLPLFSRAPALEPALPRVSLGEFPTPVQRLVIDDGTGPRNILVKRDDMCAAGYAGNKVRKLEFLLAEARRCRADRLITVGAAGSHHAFATSYHGRRAGFDVSLVLFPQSLTPHVREMLLLDHAAGAELRWAGGVAAVPWAVWRARIAHRRQRPYVVPPGGSDGIGTIGYVNGGLELAGQIAAGVMERPGRIHVAAGTLGTAAGIAIGLAWAGVRIPVAATRITPLVVTNERVLARLVRRTLGRLAEQGAQPPSAREVLELLDLRHDQVGAGYGHATAAGRQAEDVFGRAGLRLEATYTAKAAASVLADTADDGPPLFWHTLSATQPCDLAAIPDAVRMPAPFARYLARAEGAGRKRA